MRWIMLFCFLSLLNSAAFAQENDEITFRVMPDWADPNAPDSVIGPAADQFCASGRLLDNLSDGEWTCRVFVPPQVLV